MLKYIYITTGSISLSLGILGIVTPGIPTTPFLLLTAYLYAKSSPRLYQKLIDHKVTGKYIKRVNTGLSVKARIISIAIMWCMVCFTAFVIFGNETMRYVMLGLGGIGTIAQLIVLRKRKKAEEIKEEEIVESENKELDDKILIKIEVLD